jgi:ubiquinone/menaquinone biosynthesis C-methylase UbiE
VAPKVSLLNCIDPSDSIDIAKKNLKKFTNIIFHKKSLDEVNLKKNSQDFGYSLGVLHHMPDTEKAIKSCVEFLKPGAPFLIYIYYSFENRPAWFKLLWILSNFMRLIISKLPKIFKLIICDFIAFFIYYPLAKLGNFFERIGFNFSNFPLYAYRNYSLYVMRTDALDRFGTPLEKRFTKKQIYLMMKSSKLEKIKFKNTIPFWTVIGFKKK